MRNFKEYLTEELNKTTDERIKNTIIRPVTAEKSLEDIIDEANPDVWTAREVKKIKYLIFKGKTLNLTELKKNITELYNEKGYTGYGFSKLSESDLVRYTKVKDILTKAFDTDINSELDCKNVANLLFVNELKEFDWKPEEY